MRVRVDSDRCLGHAMCQAFAPEVYRVDDDSGVNEMGEFTVPDELRDSALQGARACPERSIEILDE
jgi:ferredoxin